MLVLWDVVLAVQDQKEAVMVKALENNMGDVEMASAEGTKTLALLDSSSWIVRCIEICEDCPRLEVLRVRGHCHWSYSFCVALLDGPW